MVMKPTSGMIKKRKSIEKYVVCNLDGKIFNDVENKSGILLKHLHTILPKATKENIYEYYIKTEKEITSDHLVCPCCNYTTPDYNNTSGVFTTHIKREHKLSIDKFCEKYPEYKPLWKMHFIRKNREEFIKKSTDNSIKCHICGQSFKKLSNTHLKKHNITPEEYKQKYNIQSTCSNTTTNAQKTKSFIQQIDKVFMRIYSYNVTPLFSKEEFVGVNIKNKYNFKCNVCDHTFTDHLDDGNELICRVCNPKLELTPNKKFEHQVYDYIKNELDVNEVLTNDRKLIAPKEVDLVIPANHIAIELDGLYWHSELYKEKEYHIDKTKSLNDIGYRCIHIFEDEWIYKQNIVKKKLSHILNKNTNTKIYARKCECKKISYSEKKEFLNNNHIQGNDVSSYYVGAYYDGILVSIMTFSKPRVTLGYKQNTYTFVELSRFCTDINYNVIGIASKLLKYAINTFDFKEIISYADRRYTDPTQNVYTTLGFTKISETVPNYYWVKNTQRHYRYNFRKDVLVKEGFDPNKTEVEIMHERGYYRIWDCGNFKYQLEIS